MTSANNATRTIYQVSELNTMVRELLTHSFGLLWIEGELSNLARPRSGHVYFSIKDDDAQVRCALFRSKARLLKFQPQAGDQVLVRARVGLYAARGDFQLIIEHMEPAGAGALQRAFEQLKAKLDAEDLFDERRKQALPATPKRIGVITSGTGAALRDVLSVLSRRYPLGAVRVYPVPVQGEAAPAAIVTALERAARRGDCDVLLLVRGGGSLEDLQAFNDESVARAVVACSQPVIAGVGHEVDVSIADFVADVRAPTPSAAAELVCPDLDAWRQQFEQDFQRLASNLQRRLEAFKQQRSNLHGRLARQHPRRRLEDANQRLDAAELQLTRRFDLHMSAARQRHAQWATRLYRATPTHPIQRKQTDHQALTHRLNQAMQGIMTNAAQRTNSAARALNTVSPLNTLERGYAIARTANGDVLQNAEHVDSGDAVTVALHQGQLDCRVTATHPKSDDKSSTI